MDGKTSIPAEVITQINSISPDVLQSRGVLSLAKDCKSYVCPTCGNGTGKSGDGIIPGKSAEGAWLYHCFSCGAGFNNIKLLASHYELDAANNFVDVCKRACADFNIFLPNTETKLKKNPQAFLILADIKAAQANLDNLPFEARRGLSLETYKLHGCGYTKSFTTIQRKSYTAAVPPDYHSRWQPLQRRLD